MRDLFEILEPGSKDWSLANLIDPRRLPDHRFTCMGRLDQLPAPVLKELADLRFGGLGAATDNEWVEVAGSLAR